MSLSLIHISYQVMASMDLARDFMEHEGRKICALHERTVAEIRHTLAARGTFIPIDEPSGDPLRLSVMTSCAGLSGYRAAQILEEEYQMCIRDSLRTLCAGAAISDHLASGDGK